MRRPPVRFTVLRLVVAVAVVGLLLGAADWLSLYLRASQFRHRAEAAAMMERRCREVDAMDPATRAREAALAFDNPLLDDPDWNRKMIGWFAAIRVKYEQAAANPRLPVSPDPPQP